MITGVSKYMTWILNILKTYYEGWSKEPVSSLYFLTERVHMVGDEPDFYR